MKPRIFISAVSTEFKTARQVIANELTFLDFEPISQEVLPSDCGNLSSILRQKIDSCDAVVQIVGDVYGIELPDSEFGRISYTQFEARYACSVHKPVHYLIAHPDMARDNRNVVYATDSACGTSAEKELLQQKYIKSIRSGKDRFHDVRNLDEVKLVVLRMKDELSANRRLFKTWMLAITCLVIAIVGLELFSLKNSAQQQQARVDDVSRAFAERILASYLTDSKLTMDELRKRALAELPGLVPELSQDEISEIVSVGVKRFASQAETPLARARIKITAADYDGVLAEAQSQVAQVRELELLAGAAAIAKFESESRAKYLTVAAESFLRAVALTVESDFQEWAKAANSAASVLIQLDRDAEAEQLLRKIVAFEGKSELEDAVATAENNLAVMLADADRLDEAEELARRCVATNERHYGPETPHSAMALNTLGNVLILKNNLVEADTTLQRALELGRRAGADDHRYAAILHNMAEVRDRQKNFADAEKLLRECVAISERNEGPLNPNLAAHLSTLARVLSDANRVPEALLLIRRDIAIREHIFGLEAPQVAKSLNALALNLEKEGQLTEAQKVLVRAIKIEEGTQAGKDREKATQLNNLVIILLAQNRLTAAEPLIRRAIMLDESLKSSSLRPILYSNYAQILHRKNKLAEAEAFARHALATTEATIGTEHPDTAVQFNNLGGIFLDKYGPTIAEIFFRRALSIDEASRGAMHPDSARDLGNLGGLLVKFEGYALAEPLSRRALAISHQSCNVDHPVLASALNSYGLILQEMKYFAEAKALHRHALAIVERTKSSNHPEVAVSLNSLSSILTQEKRYRDAEVLVRRAFIILSRFYGRTGIRHPSLDSVASNYRLILEELKYPPPAIAKTLENTQFEALETQAVLPEVDRVVGKSATIDEILASIELQVKDTEKSGISSLPLGGPVSSLVGKLLDSDMNKFVMYGYAALNDRQFPQAHQLFKEAIDLAPNTREGPWLLSMLFSLVIDSHLEMGLLDRSNEELGNLLCAIAADETADPLVKGRVWFQSATCDWKLGKTEPAVAGLENAIQYQRQANNQQALEKSQELMQNIKSHKKPEIIVQDETELLKAEAAFHCLKRLAACPITEPVSKMIDEMVGPAKSVSDVLSSLDSENLKAGNPEVWSLPLTKPISPYLDSLINTF